MLTSSHLSKGSFFATTPGRFSRTTRAEPGNSNGHSQGNLPDDPLSHSMDVGVDSDGFKPRRFDEIQTIMKTKAEAKALTSRTQLSALNYPPLILVEETRRLSSGSSGSFSTFNNRSIEEDQESVATHPDGLRQVRNGMVGERL